jgi:uncharacterized membrane protein
LVLSVVFATNAAGIGAAYDNKTTQATADAETKQQLHNAAQLATLRMNLEKSIEKTSKFAISKRIALKTMLNKVKKAEKTNSNVNSLLRTIGVILIIVGLALIILAVLSVITTGGYGYGGGGGLLVLGLILWLIGRYVEL